ncbi:MAG: hypothetical protein FWG46_03615 [Treponema sp.]|nr:hypothetical protein [Treponema sp.]
MKKAIVVSLLVFLAGGAFAQITLKGELYAGFEIKSDFNNETKANTSHRKYGDPYINFNVAAQWEDYGLKFDTDVVAGDPFTQRLNGLYGWAGFLDNAIRFSVGKISDSIWITNLDPDREIYFDRITGMRIEYGTPLPGLRIGAAFPAQDFEIEKFAKKIILGASYINPMLNAVVSYDMGNNGQFLFGANYTGIPDLTDAGIEIDARNLATWEAPVLGGSLQLKEKVGYRVMRPLNVSLLMGQKFFGAPESDVELFFQPSASYRLLPALTASLTLKLATPDSFGSTDIHVTPCLEYTLKGMALLYAEYELKLSEYKKDSYHRFGVGIDIKSF